MLHADCNSLASSVFNTKLSQVDTVSWDENNYTVDYETYKWGIVILSTVESFLKYDQLSE